MPQKNTRLLVVGGTLIIGAILFFLCMMTTAPRSNDPVSLMRTVGQVSGAVGGIGLVMMAVGARGKRRPPVL